MRFCADIHLKTLHSCHIHMMNISLCFSGFHFHGCAWICLHKKSAILTFCVTIHNFHRRLFWIEITVTMLFIVIIACVDGEFKFGGSWTAREIKCFFNSEMSLMHLFLNSMQK